MSPGRRQLLFSLRYVVPAVICITGIVIAFIAGPDSYGPDAMSALFGAGGAVYLINTLLRMGMTGDADRDVEEARRMFVGRYGVWPDEVAAEWRAPDTGDDVHTTMRRLVGDRVRSDVAA